MAKTIRSADTAATNWQSRTSGASDFWKSQANASAWQTYAASDLSETNYNSAMAKVLSGKTRQKSVQGSSDGVWKAGINANATRFSQGVSTGKDRQKAAITAILTDISNAVKTLPARGPRGSDTNITGRGTGIQKALAANRGKYRAKGVPRSSA